METLKNKNVLVTGAGGFIGSHLVGTLVPLCKKVTALVHYDSRANWSNLEFLPEEILKNTDVIPGDVTDGYCMRNLVKGNDIVLHLAALISIPYSYRAPESFFVTNTLGTIKILESCLQENVEKLVITSTSETYGTAQTVPMDENHPLQAQSPYAASKIGADKAAESYCNAFNLPVVTLRPFNTYGPRQSARAVIPTIITQALSDSSEIRLGSLSPIRDLTFVQDTVRGFIMAAIAGGVDGEVFNLGTGEGVSIGELTDIIQSLIGCNKTVITDEERIRPEHSEVMRLLSDNAKATRMLGWRPRYTLQEGLMETIDFIKRNLSFYKTGRYMV